MSVYGGMPLVQQQKDLQHKRPQLLVATPGRLVDFLERKSISLANCTKVVLDEADRMLEMGFEPQLKTIFEALPSAAERQTLFFTATWPKSVRKLAAKFLREDGVGSVTLFVDSKEADHEEPTANIAVSQKFIQVTISCSNHPRLLQLTSFVSRQRTTRRIKSFTSFYVHCPMNLE